MVETGTFYSSFIDPILKGMRKKLIAHINETETVIDIACGTGAQVFEIANKAKHVVGVDLSESMIRFAKKKQEKLEIENAEFVVADATQLSDFKTDEFDVATMSLALHQFPPDTYSAILEEMKRVAKRIVIIDYVVPLQRDFVGVTCKAIEFLAGIEHNRCFRKYYKLGGLKTILPDNGLEIKRMNKIGGGAFCIVECKVE